MASISFIAHFDVSQLKFRIQDTSNYAIQGIDINNVKGVIKITTPRGVTYNNTNYLSPDLVPATSLFSGLIPLPLNAQGYVLAGAYSIQYSILNTGDNTVSSQINSYTYSFIVPAIAITQTVDGYNSTFTSLDATSYGTYSSLSRVHTVTPPSGSPLSVTTNNNQSIFYAANIWSGVWTSQITSTVSWTEGDGLVIDAVLTKTQTVTAYLNDMNVIRGYIETFKLLYDSARATSKELAYRIQASLIKISIAYDEYDLALYYNDLLTAYLRTVDIINELNDYITITFPEEIEPFINHGGGAGHAPVSIGTTTFGVTINSSQVLSFTLATNTHAGMMPQLSGSTTDYLGGDGTWHSFVSSVYALKADFDDYLAVTAITASQITNWNIAFSWGDHAAAGYSLAANVYTKTDLQTSGQASVHWGNITNTPTTVAGYGITDAMAGNAPIVGATKTKITYDSKGLVTAGTDLIASDIPNLPWSKITSGLPTTLAGYGITNAYTKTEIDAKTWPWTSITATPTTIAGYGITNAYTKTEVDAKTWDFTTAITGKPTTLAGYGITDGLSTSHPANNVINSGGGTLFLADDGTYKAITLSGPTNTQIVYMNGTAAAGSAGLTWNNASSLLTATNASIETGTITTQLNFIDTTMYIKGDTGSLTFSDTFFTKTLSELVSGGIIPAGNILDWDVANSWYAPFAAQTTGAFDSSTTNPVSTTRLNYDGNLHVFTSYSYNGFITTGVSTTGYIGSITGAKPLLLSQSGDYDTAFNYNSLDIVRTPNMLFNDAVSGSFISITDNPTTSGAISGKIFTATLGATEKIYFDPRVTDGASAIAFRFDTQTTLATTGARLVSWANAGTEKASIDYAGTLRAINANFSGKLTVGGLIDPTGLQLTPVAANPGNAATLWVNSGDGNKLYFGPSAIGSDNTLILPIPILYKDGDLDLNTSSVTISAMDNVNYSYEWTYLSSFYSSDRVTPVVAAGTYTCTITHNITGTTASADIIVFDYTSRTFNSNTQINASVGYILDLTAGAGTLFNFGVNGKQGIGIASPTAWLHLRAGEATATRAPLKFTAGVNLTAAEAGAMEWDGTNLFITQTTGPTRKTIAYTDSTANLVDDILDFSTDKYTPYTSKQAGVCMYTGSENPTGTTRVNINAFIYPTWLRSDYGIFQSYTNSGDAVLSVRGGNNATGDAIAWVTNNAMLTQDEDGNNVLELSRTCDGISTYKADGHMLDINDYPSNQNGTVTGSLIRGSVDGSIVLNFNPRVSATGGTAYIFDTHNALTSSNILSLKNAGTEKFYVNSSGKSLFTAGTSSTFAIQGGCLKDFTSSSSTSGTGETDLYSYTIPANTLANNGDKITAHFAGTFSTTSGVLAVYFCGESLGVTSDTDSNGLWTCDIVIIRISSTSFKVSIKYGYWSTQHSDYDGFSSKDFTIGNILKITGTAANNSITAEFGSINYIPAAIN